MERNFHFKFKRKQEFVYRKMIFESSTIYNIGKERRKEMTLIPLIVYRIVKNSSDRTFEVGDLIWETKNGDIMCPNKGGWIEKEEFQSHQEMSDFEAEVDKEHFVFSTGKQERMMSIQEMGKQIERQKMA